jgi:hypothetical protein
MEGRPMPEKRTIRFTVWPSEKSDIFDTPTIGILQVVDVDFVAGRWQVTGGNEGGPTWRGEDGDDLTAAILDWLAARLGLKEEATPDA